MYTKPLVIADIFKMKLPNPTVQPYNIRYSDLQSINCPLRSILYVQSQNINKLFIKKIISDILSAVILRSDSSILEACAITLVILSGNSDMYLPTQFSLLEKVLQYYSENVYISEEKIINICKETLNQSENSMWFDVRRLRISASFKAHAIKSR